MAQPELTGTLGLVDPGTVESGAKPTTTQIPDASAVTDPSGNPARASTLNAVGTAATCPEPPAYFGDALQDAERLLKYAAEIGIDVDDGIRNDVLLARTHSGSGWNEKVAANLLAALTKLAARLKPVTAESLKACCSEERHAVRGYFGWAMCLAAIIVPFSLASFVASGLSDAIRKDIVTANELAVKLTTQLHSAPAAGQTGSPTADGLPSGLSVVEVVTELQQLASLIRAVDGRALRVNRLVANIEVDPYRGIRPDVQEIHKKFQLPEDLPKHLVEAADDRITVYQDVRYFAQSLLDDVSVFYGAIAACLLPVLYALLGTCAYLLRSFEQQMNARTFTPSVANSARFLIAGIGGAVVGLFNNYAITQGASLPPLAIAFLVGYAVDVFFSFLEGLLQAFTKSKNGEVAPATAKSSAT